MRRLLVFVLVVLALGGTAMYFTGGGKANRDVEVMIARGSSMTAAARVLERVGAVDSASSFVRRAKLFGSGEPIKPGEYKIKKGMDEGEILSLLQSGKTLQRLVMIPEGMPSIMVQERLMATELLTGDVTVPPEGSVLPDSYAYSRGETRSAVLGRMQKAMQTALANAWAARKPTAAVTTPEQAVILASIIEKETARASERRMVSAVYTNRLKRGMKLEADPTSIYLTSRGKPLGRRILQSELDAKNAYNTYEIVGLPIGPITNPGKAAIEAALDPAPSNAIFFVAQPDGSSAFTETYGEHDARVREWVAHRKAKGEM